MYNQFKVAVESTAAGNAHQQGAWNEQPSQQTGAAAHFLGKADAEAVSWNKAIAKTARRRVDILLIFRGVWLIFD